MKLVLTIDGKDSQELDLEGTQWVIRGGVITNDENLVFESSERSGSAVLFLEHRGQRRLVPTDGIVWLNEALTPMFSVGGLRIALGIGP